MEEHKTDYRTHPRGRFKTRRSNKANATHTFCGPAIKNSKGPSLYGLCAPWVQPPVRRASPSELFMVAWVQLTAKKTARSVGPRTRSNDRSGPWTRTERTIRGRERPLPLLLCVLGMGALDRFITGCSRQAFIFKGKTVN